MFFFLNKNLVIYKIIYRHSLVYLGLGIFATHFIPILLILRLYNLNKNRGQEG